MKNINFLINTKNKLLDLFRFMLSSIKMKRIIVIIIYGLTFFVLMYFMLNYEIQKLDSKYIKTLWHNIKFVSSALYTLIPLLFIFVFLSLLFTNKWALRVEKLSIGGFSILFDNPSNLYKRQVRNLLNTKRTVFKINCNDDNFKETFDSYFDIYKFFRDEIKVFGNVKGRRFSSNETMELYKLTNETIKVLNDFLTEHQSNYRRWYTYLEKIDEERYYLTPIGELQKEYVNYDKLCDGFIEVNKFFRNKIAIKFEIDMNKWGIDD